MAISVLVDSSGDAVEAVEGSSLGITVSFFDDDGNAETPDSANWTLTDGDGTVINEKEEESISNPSTSNTITLSGADLDLLATETGEVAVRRFVVQAVYNSDLGNNLPMVEAVAFSIRNVKYAMS